MKPSIIKVTDLTHWHCVRCNAKLNALGLLWQPGDLEVYATTIADARKTCFGCEDKSVFSPEEQVAAIFRALNG